jgi:hypothetical protein
VLRTTAGGLRYGGQDGAFADIGFATARKSCDFCGLQGRIK